MHKYPNRLRVGNDGGAVFEREPELYAVHRHEPARQEGPPPRRAGSSTRAGGEAAPVAVVRDGATSSFAVYRGQPGSEVSEAEVGPVYSAVPGGPLAVPTGRVLVRLAKGMRPEERKREFASAGFEIEKTLAYAPSAAWLKAREGSVAQALNNLAALEKTPGVEHVEPQLLMERAFRRA